MVIAPHELAAQTLLMEPSHAGLREFGELLRSYRNDRALTQAAAAESLRVSRASFAQWETGRHLPAEERVRELDRILEADGSLIAVFEQVRAAQRVNSVDTQTTTWGPSRPLRQIFDEVRNSLLNQLCYADDGRTIGWRHNLVPSEDAPSLLSSAYALRALAVLGGPAGNTSRVVDSIMDRAVRVDGELVGWSARTQVAPRLEITAGVLDALLRIGVPIDPDEVVRMLKNLIDESTLARPFIIASALEPLLRAAPDSGLVSELVEALLDCRVSFGGIRLWPEKRLHRDQPMLGPSVVHTARAVTVLRNLDSEITYDSVLSAESWIAGAHNLDGVTEVIRRDLAPDRREELTIQHFTAAWVVRALAGATRPDRRAMARALERLWERFDPNLHFWTWGNGDVPVWMLADAVAALHDAALALLPSPGSDADPLAGSTA